MFSARMIWAIGMNANQGKLVFVFLAMRKSMIAGNKYERMEIMSPITPPPAAIASNMSGETGSCGRPGMSKSTPPGGVGASSACQVEVRSFPGLLSGRDF
jgi:hypothetical protein